MRDIRSRISQRHGIELTTQQIQELAARRLEAILDPRTVKPSLLEQIRRSTSTPLDTATPPELAYSFEDTTIYDSHRGSLRFIRRLLNPLLRLFFNPNPLIAALNTQAKLNQAAALREAERERRQAEWNALHYEILQRLVLEVSRTSLEAQQLTMRIEALSTKPRRRQRRFLNYRVKRPPPTTLPRQSPRKVPLLRGAGGDAVAAAADARRASRLKVLRSGRRRERRRPTRAWPTIPSLRMSMTRTRTKAEPKGTRAKIKPSRLRRHRSRRRLLKAASNLTTFRRRRPARR